MRPYAWRRIVGIALMVAAACGFGWYQIYSNRLIPVGELRVDPAASIDPEKSYSLVVWEREVPLPWETGAHRKALEEAIAEFEAVWPNIDVELTVFAWYEGDGPLHEAITQGSPPDVYGMNTGARLIDTEWQIPVDAYLTEDARADLMESAIRTTSDGRRMWAFPRWIAPRVWIAREDLTPALAEARVSWDGAQFIETLEEALRSTRADGLAANPFDPSLFYEVMVASTGKNLIGQDGRRAWSVEEMTEVLAFFEALLEKGLISKDAREMSRTRMARFWSRRAAVIAPVNPWLLRHTMARGGVMESGEERPIEGDHLTLAVPPPAVGQGGSGGYHPASVSGFAVFLQRPYKGDDHTKAAMLLAEHLSRRLGPWEAAHLFAVPAHPSAWENWRDDAGLPEKELDLLIEWSGRAVGPPLDERRAKLQEEAFEKAVVDAFAKLWSGAAPEAVANEIAAELDGLRAEVGIP